MVSLDIRKPMVVMGGALSQSPVRAAFEARIRALSIWGVQLAKRMLKDFCNFSVPKLLLSVDFIG